MIDEIVVQAAIVFRETQKLIAMMPGLPIAAAPDDEPHDLIELGVAAQIARRSKSVVRKWCAKNLMSGGGFAMKIADRWYVSASRFRAYIRR
ncbi:hypothetical protein BJ122_105102 [Rhodopseudomonas faecalis]|uniref:Uncharacterized protein n=1 Tax=Rhodopseudomonas faecalis TaxID=99655 RepID=A0A318TPK7_9BRAD|nr:hypothetical protein [Rhodopseudomonas faecalis]PYF03845.1 hypothetical protein BJ122_105102 [Rhodopseudomonas faecalis]